jgi:hypothetical protein
MRAVVLLIVGLWAGAATAENLRIGYLSLSGDTRYQQDWGYARLIVPPPSARLMVPGWQSPISPLWPRR